MRTATLHFRLTKRSPVCVPDGDPYGVELKISSYEPAYSILRIDLGDASRLRKVEQRVANNQATKEDLKDIGVTLLAGLLGDAVRERFEQVLGDMEDDEVQFHIRLSLPPELQDFSWEALYDDRRGFMAEHDRFAVIRDPPAGMWTPARKRKAGSLAVLVAIPTGSNLHVDHEMANLSRAVKPLGDALTLVQLEGRVTPERLADKLESAAWDVFHFVGHGRIDKQGGALLRLNGEQDEDHWIDAERLAAIFRRSPVQLAVLNSCLGAQPDPTRSLSGIGPYLIRAGVRSVVAMRYEIKEGDALCFSESFYKELFKVGQPGRIDLAVERARYDLFRRSSESNVRSFITPVLTVAEGYECLSGLPEWAPEPAGVPPPPPADAQPVPELPLELLAAVRDGRCLPIIGPGLLGADVMRSNGGPPGPLGMARRIAKLDGYTCPLVDDMDWAEGAGDWAALHVLQQICEHYLYRMQGPYRLTKSLLDAYSNAPIPPVMLTLAGWQLPGVVCTYFDGLMARSLDQVGKRPRVLERFEDETAGGEDTALVVNLRGSVADASSLVLTERKNEEAINRLSGMSRHVKDLVHRGAGRVLLFLGVSPRDLLVRRYVTELLPRKREDYLSLAGIYFVQPRRSEVDEAYWHRFEVEWIDDTPDRVIHALTEAARPA